MKLREFENQIWRKKIQQLAFRHKAALKLIDKGPVLDLGCGDGFFLKELEKKRILGKGLDIFDEAVRKAKEKGLKVKQFDFTSQKLPFKENSFETVVMLDVLEHLYDPLSLLKEARRVTKNYIVLSMPNFNSFPERLKMVLGKVPPVLNQKEAIFTG